MTHTYWTLLGIVLAWISLAFLEIEILGSYSSPSWIYIRLFGKRFWIDLRSNNQNVSVVENKETERKSVKCYPLTLEHHSEGRDGKYLRMQKPGCGEGCGALNFNKMISAKEIISYDRMVCHRFFDSDTSSYLFGNRRLIVPLEATIEEVHQ